MASSLEKLFRVTENTDALDFSNYQDINNNQVRLVNDAFHGDYVIQACFNAVMNDQLGAGISFKLGDSKVPDEDSDRFLQSVYKRWCTELYASCIKFGFALAMVDRVKHLGGIPRILDPLFVDVKILTTQYNTRKYAVFQRQIGITSTHAPVPSMRELLPGVVVFEIGTETPPDMYGNLRSKIYHIVERHKTRFDFIQVMHTRAIDINANPLLFEERKEQKYNPEDALLGDVFAPPVHGGDLDTEDKKVSVDEIRRMHEQASVIQNYNAGRGVTKIGDSVSARAVGSTKVEMITLRENSSVINPLQAQPVSDLDTLRVAYEEAVCAIMGIPRRMVCDSSYRVAGDANISMEVYNKNKFALKTHLVECLTRMYYFINGEADINATAIETNASDPFLLAKATKVVISLPGVPAPQEMKEIHDSGVLETKAYVEYLVRRFDLPIESFKQKATPPIHPDDLVPTPVPTQTNNAPKRKQPVSNTTSSAKTKKSKTPASKAKK
jgi:hypothetical protein